MNDVRDTDETPMSTTPDATSADAERSVAPRPRLRDRRPCRWVRRLGLRVQKGYAAWVAKNSALATPEDAEAPVAKPWRGRWPEPLRILADWLHPLPLDPPWSFPQSIDRLWEQLRTDDDDLADELLADARQLFAEADANVKSAESRASTLQQTVAIAASVAFVGGGLALDRTSLHPPGWRVAFAVGLATLVLLLGLTALRATGARARLAWFWTASDKDILSRAQMASAALAKTKRAAYLLHGYGRNAELAHLKVIYLRKAVFWFRGAVIVLVLMMGLVCAYVIDTGSPKTTATTSITKPTQASGGKTPTSSVSSSTPPTLRERAGSGKNRRH